MSGHLDGPPPGPPDPPYIPGDLGAPSAEEFARRRASTEPRPENPYRTVHARMSPPGAAWDEGFAAGRAAERAANVKLLREYHDPECSYAADEIEARSVSPAPTEGDTE